MYHLPLLRLFGFLFLYWRQKLSYHLSILFYLGFTTVCSLYRFTLSRLILLFQIFGLVVIITAFMQIYIHLMSHSPYSSCLTNPWPSSNDQSQKLPLIFFDILIYLAWTLLRCFVDKTILFTYLILILEESIQPIHYLLSNVGTKQLWYLNGSIFATPEWIWMWLDVFLQYHLY